jgi:hypothetical protein
MTRKSVRTILYAAALLGGTAIQATPAFAQATRTWVSGVGDDVNPCSRTAPCKTFSGAISKTANGGEINCLDPAGYGAVTINKSLVIDCHYTEGGALAAGNGIVVNATSTDTIVLRGLDIFGVNPPTNGIRILVAASVHIEDCVIRRFNAANSFGISFQPSGATQLFISNTRVTTNGNGATGGGILIQPTGAGTAKVLMKDVMVVGNANDGVHIDSQANPASFQQVVMVNTDVAGNNNGVNTVSPAAGTPNMIVSFQNSRAVNNTSTGLISNGKNIYLVGDSTIAGNLTGVSIINGGAIDSYGTNHLNGNSSDGAFTPPIINPE